MQYCKSSMFRLILHAPSSIQAIDRHLIFSHSTRNHHGADSTHTCTEQVREHIVPGWSPTRSLTLSTPGMRNEPCIC